MTNCQPCPDCGCDATESLTTDADDTAGSFSQHDFSRRDFAQTIGVSAAGVGDNGEDGVWDSWRPKVPSFVWSFRGSPRVHVGVNMTADPLVKLNASG